LRQRGLVMGEEKEVLQIHSLRILPLRPTFKKEIMKVFLFLSFAIVLVIILFYISARERRKEYFSKLQSVSDRVSNYEEIILKLKELSISDVEVYVDNILKKFKLIDALEPYKNNITNDDIKKLENVHDVLEVEKAVLKLIKKAKLAQKYNSSFLASRLAEKDYFIGMKIEHLIDCEGKPERIETEVFQKNTTDTYFYTKSNTAYVFVFLNRKLKSFKKTTL